MSVKALGVQRLFGLTSWRCDCARQCLIGRQQQATATHKVLPIAHALDKRFQRTLLCICSWLHVVNTLPVGVCSRQSHRQQQGVGKLQHFET